MNKNNENNATHKSEIKDTMAFTQSLCGILRERKTNKIAGGFACRIREQNNSKT
jgi:hypothetical protein